jgi:O-antigen ligase
MKSQNYRRILLILCAILYTILLYFFYVRYVPLILAFQIVLLPLLVLVLILASIRPEQGTIFFVFIFPLINNLPYFFGIHEHIPHAPTASVLFLFFFFGWMIHRVLFPSKSSSPTPNLRPLWLFILIVAVSSLISFVKFANFFPLLSDSIYELTTNVNGVTAGGALMNTLFHTLNYLTGIALFFIVVSVSKSKDFSHKLLLVLTMSVFLSLFLGFYQAFQDPGLGNTPFWVRMGQINATFKDPNALGAVLAMTCPVVLSLVIVFKGARRIFALLVLAMMFALFPHIGSRSAFLGLVVAVLSFFILLGFLSTKFKEWRRNRKVLLGGAVAVAILFVSTIFIGLNKTRLFDRLRDYSKISKTQGIFLGVSPERFFLWKEALAMFKDYPLSGVGIGSYIIELPNYYTYDRGSYQQGWKLSGETILPKISFSMSAPKQG